MSAIKVHQDISTTTGVTSSSSGQSTANSSSTTTNSLQHHQHHSNNNNIINQNNNNSNHNNTLLTTFQQQQQQQDDESIIPTGYSVHIKASNKMNNTPTTNQSMSSSTNKTSSSLTNTSLPTLTSSESLSAFNLFDGFSNFPIITAGPSSTSSLSGSSSLTNALFNTNPIPMVDTMIVPAGNNNHNNIVTDETVAQIVSNNSVPEFLYQLTKMLTDDHRDIIEWSNGKIEVHSPTKLEKEVLNQYFRHSKYASFQRQLNYFGFRKLAGKGKMAPCSYINENATSDLKSLLRMKRKTSATTKDGKPVTTESDTIEREQTMSSTMSSKSNDNRDTARNKSRSSHGSNRNNNNKKPSKRARTTIRHPSNTYNDRHPGAPPTHSPSSPPKIKIAKGSGIKHQLNGYRSGSVSQPYLLDNTTISSSSTTSIPTSSVSKPPVNNPLVPDPISGFDPASIAKAAVGKGVTHQYHPSNTQKSTSINGVKVNGINNGIPTDSSNRFTFLDPSQLGMGIENCLSELKNNFRNSLNEANAKADISNINNDDANNIDNNSVSSYYYPQYTSLTRESSLVDLAIIPSLHTSQSTSNMFLSSSNNYEKTLESEYGMTFIDFPTDGIDPSSLTSCNDGNNNN